MCPLGTSLNAHFASPFRFQIDFLLRCVSLFSPKAFVYWIIKHIYFGLHQSRIPKLPADVVPAFTLAGARFELTPRIDSGSVGSAYTLVVVITPVPV